MNFASIMFPPGGRLRPGWRILLYIGLTAFAAQLAVWFYYALGGLGLPDAILRIERANLILLDVLLCLAAIGTAVVLIRYVDARAVGALGYYLHGRVRAELAQGALLGAAMVAAVAGTVFLSGSGRFAPAHSDVKSILCNGSLYLVTFTCAAVLEEVLARGYVFQALIEGTGRTAAVAITSGVFGLGHAINPHATMLSMLNTVLAGVWLAVGYLKTRSLWLPTAMHISWNFWLGYVFGFPVSGLPVSGPLLQFDASGPEWITGGSYGPEGGVLCAAAMFLCTTWIARSARIRPPLRVKALWLPEKSGTSHPFT